jgi:hypothetical protein
MLTNEKAALAKASVIFDELKTKNIKKFVDVDFGPAKKDD